MAIGLTQNAVLVANSTTTASASLATAVALGNVVVAAVQAWDGSTSTFNPTVTDNLGLTWQTAVSYSDATNGTHRIIYALVTTAGSLTVTVTQAGATWALVCVSEWSGILLTTPLDGVNSNLASGSGDSGSVTTTADGDLLWGWFNFSADGTAASDCFVGAHNYYKMLEFKLQATAGSASCSYTATSGTSNLGLIAAFKAAPNVLVNANNLLLSPWGVYGTGASALTATTLRCASSGTTSALQSVALKPSTSYTVRIRMAAVSGTPGTGSCSVYASDYSSTYGTTGTITLTTTAQALSFTFTTGSGVTGGVFQIDYAAGSINSVQSVTNSYLSITGSAMPKALTDSISITTVVVRQPGKNPTESFSLSESIARQVRRSIAEAFSFAESVARKTARTIGETFSLADAVGTAKAKLLLLVDSFSLADAVSTAKAKVLLVVDSFSLSDAVSTVKAKFLQFTETFSLADTLVRSVAHTLGFAEAFLVADTLARLTRRVVTDTLSPTDAVTAARLRVLALFEALALSDTLSRLTGRSVLEGLALSDALSRQPARSVSDQLPLTDSLTRLTAKAFTEILGLFESVVSQFTSGASLLGQTAHRFVVERLRRLWRVKSPGRLYVAESPVRRWTATEMMIIADPKDAEASENYQLDWDDLGSDTITSSTWEISPAGELASVSDSHDDTTTVVRLSGGVAGRKYVVKNVVTLASGQIKAQPLLVPIT
jgi:hypothetical protein